MSLPDLPTINDFVPGHTAIAFNEIGAPAGTPTAVIDTLNKEINAGRADPKIRAKLADLGGLLLAGSPAGFAKLIADDTEKWAKVIRAANIKAE